ncbi:hypothetical protein OH77DRAFT_1401438 [Trametes cingulata]|nr:hypothetical protein OH77DRAFT_1401438 [Trametes cingulata]
MSGIEFVIEVPQSNRQNKKRPRLVTSCDNCRVKKIKCIQRPSTDTCEACATAGIPCLYRDREQYFAERTRLLTGVTTTPSHASSSGRSTPQHPVARSSPPCPPSTTAPGGPAADHFPGAFTSMASYPQMDAFAAVQDHDQALLGGLYEQPAVTVWYTPPPSVSQYPNMHFGVAPSAPMPASSTSPQLSGLFDPSYPTQPNPSLMVDFIRAFFDKLGETYPFLSLEIVRDQFIRHKLSPLLANCIAASAARYSTLPQIQQIGSANVADVYCQMAKVLISSNAEAASLDHVHALMLLSWAECQRGRSSAFSTYAKLAIRFATELGITDEALPQLTQVLDPRMAGILHATLQGIRFLKTTNSAAEASSSAASNSSAGGTSQNTLWNHIGIL